MRNFPVYTAVALCLMLSSMTAASADGGHVKVPRHVPVKAFGESTRGDDTSVFSAPDGQDSVPTFVGKKGQPMTMDAEPRMAGFDHTRLLTNVTKEQQTKITAIQQVLNVAVSNLNDQMNALRAKLVPPPPKVDADAIKTQIDDLNKQIKDRRKSASEELESVLTDEQRDQIRRMRAGEIVSP